MCTTHLQDPVWIDCDAGADDALGKTISNVVSSHAACLHAFDSGAVLQDYYLQLKLMLWG